MYKHRSALLAKFPHLPPFRTLQIRRNPQSIKKRYITVNSWQGGWVRPDRWAFWDDRKHFIPSSSPTFSAIFSLNKYLYFEKGYHNVFQTWYKESYSKTHRKWTFSHLFSHVKKTCIQKKSSSRKKETRTQLSTVVGHNTGSRPSIAGHNTGPRPSIPPLSDQVVHFGSEFFNHWAADVGQSGPSSINPLNAGFALAKTIAPHIEHQGARNLVSNADSIATGVSVGLGVTEAIAFGSLVAARVAANLGNLGNIGF